MVEFAPRLDILPEPQRRVWDELATVPPQFVLYGGTAIALHLGHRQPDNGLQVASLLDLAGTKAAVVQQRAEAKDYIDVAAILDDGRIDLPMALASAQAIYGAPFNPQITLKALSFFEDGTLRRLPIAVKGRLAAAAREVDLDRLPTIAQVAR